MITRPVPVSFNGEEFINQMSALGWALTLDDFYLDADGMLNLLIEDPAIEADFDSALTEHVGGESPELAVERQIDQKLADALAELQLIIDTVNPSVVDLATLRGLSRNIKDLARIQRTIIRKLMHILDSST